jgi:hypothetical protein
MEVDMDKQWITQKDLQDAFDSERVRDRLIAHAMEQEPVVRAAMRNVLARCDADDLTDLPRHTYVTMIGLCLLAVCYEKQEIKRELFRRVEAGEIGNLPPYDGTPRA